VSLHAVSETNKEIDPAGEEIRSRVVDRGWSSGGLLALLLIHR
jgi:hypothetical protein